MRARLMMGASAIAGLAVLSSLLFIFGAIESARRVDEAVAAQHRMELLSLLSARVGDYAMVAVEATKAGSRSRGDQVALLKPRADVVETAFDRLNRALDASVRDAQSENEPEQMRRATRGLGLARMQAQFERLTRTLSQHDGIDESRLRSALDSFATQFSPLLDQAIAEERRDRDAGFASAETFRKRLIWFAWGIVALALLLLGLFQFGLVRPLIGRIGRITGVARTIGSDGEKVRLAIDRRDELGLLFANVNRTAARIDRRRSAVDADRAQLNAIIETRTGELAAANARLETADAQRRRFFADVSHELRTPLTVILAEADLGMRASEVNEEETRRSMALIHTRARRLNRRIDDLLRVARSESGEIDLTLEPFDAVAAVADAIGDVEALAKRRRLSLTTSGAVSAFVVGDCDWTRQIVSGLIDNAIRHSPDGAAIDVAVNRREDTIEIIVSDAGEGIPPERQTAVFERFERATDRPGFGVGLSLARWIIERQSGSIAIQSPGSNGIGTDVVIHLPRAMATNEENR